MTVIVTPYRLLLLEYIGEDSLEGTLIRHFAFLSIRTSTVVLCMLLRHQWSHIHVFHRLPELHSQISSSIAYRSQ